MKFKDIVKKVLVILRVLSIIVLVVLSIFILNITKSISIIEFIEASILNNVYFPLITSPIIIMISSMIISGIEVREKKKKENQRWIQNALAGSDYRTNTSIILSEISTQLLSKINFTPKQLKNMLMTVKRTVYFHEEERF